MANNTVGFESKILQDVGVGYYASYDKFFGQIQAAFKVGNENVTSEPNKDSRVLFKMGMSF